MTGGVDGGLNPCCDFLFTPGRSSDPSQQSNIVQHASGPCSHGAEIKLGSYYNFAIINSGSLKLAAAESVLLRGTTYRSPHERLNLKSHFRVIALTVDT